MNDFFNGILNRVRSYKEEDLREFVEKKARVDDIVVSHFIENQDSYNFSDSLKVGDKELEKIADELSQRFNTVFKLDTKDSDKVLSALLEKKEIEVKLSDSSDLKITRRMKNGFTLIELMITVAIIGVLSAVAIPSYQDYVARSQVSEAIVLGSGAKPLVAEYYANNGEYPLNSNAVGYSSAVGKYVENVSIQSGNIVVTFNKNVNKQLIGKTVVLSPSNGQDITIADSNFIYKLLGISNAVAGENSWSCYSDIESKYLPKSCETREFNYKNQNPDNGSDESIELWKDSNNSYLIEEDKSYVIKDFNNLPRSSLGSMLDISKFTNGSLDDVVFERDGANTIIKIGDSKNTITIENVDMSNDGQLNSEQIKLYQLQRGKLKF